MKVWEVEVELNMNASNTIKLEIVASTEHKAFFTKIVNVKYLGIHRKS